MENSLEACPARQRRRVVLYGHSLILGTLGAMLQQYTHLEIVSLSPPLAQARELSGLSPSVVIFDLGAVPADFPFLLLGEQPDLVLMGLDAAGGRLLLLSGQLSRALTPDQLVRVIEMLPDSV